MEKFPILFQVVFNVEFEWQENLYNCICVNKKNEDNFSFKYCILFVQISEIGSNQCRVHVVVMGTFYW